jgi:hypothetical protein
MSGLPFRQFLADPSNGGTYVFFVERATYAETTEGGAVELRAADIARAFLAQIFMAAALDNAQQCLFAAQFFMFRETTLGPETRPFHRRFLPLIRFMRRQTFVKGKYYVRAYVVLYLYGFLRSEAMLGAVND